MGYPPIEDLLPKTGYSIYKLVRMAANRAMELADGKKPLVEVSLNEKTATIALEEIRSGKVVLKDVAEKFKPAEYDDKKSDPSRLKTEEPELSAN